MSTTIEKRTLAEAAADAMALRGLFAGTYREWLVAGSVRRRCPTVGDVEHVVVPRLGEVAVVGGLFAEQRTVNLTLARADLLTQPNVGGHPDVGRHVYPDGRQRWGERYRGLSFRGFAHELFIADVDRSNLGPTLAIRTGPAEFSKRLVTALRARGMRNHEGYIWRCERCPRCTRAGKCPGCGDGMGLVPVERLPVVEEREALALAGIPWTEPEARR